MTTVYGITNCDSVKKARKWLETNQIDYQFHDLRRDGLTTEKLTDWAKQVSWQTLLNKRSTTWKQLDDQTRANIDQSSALATMLTNPTLIKRPVLENGGAITVGFKADNYQTIFFD